MQLRSCTPTLTWCGEAAYGVLMLQHHRAGLEFLDVKTCARLCRLKQGWLVQEICAGTELLMSDRTEPRCLCMYFAYEVAHFGYGSDQRPTKH